MITNRQMSRIAGIGYLIIFVTGIFANFFVIKSLWVPGDAPATFENIRQNTGSFQIGIIAFILMVIFDLILVWALYYLLLPVNKQLSLLTAWLRLVNVALFGAALYHLPNILKMANSPGIYSLTAPDASISILMSFESYNFTWLIGLLFFGIHLVLLGWLIYKSGYIPKIIGILLFIAGAGYLVDSTAQMLLPNYSDYESIFMIIVILPGIVGELSLTLWLLIKGVRY
jgi:uncharacterized membrane protein